MGKWSTGGEGKGRGKERNLSGNRMVVLNGVSGSKRTNDRVFLRYFLRKGMKMMRVRNKNDGEKKERGKNLTKSQDGLGTVSVHTHPKDGTNSLL